MSPFVWPWDWSFGKMFIARWLGRVRNALGTARHPFSVPEVNAPIGVDLGFVGDEDDLRDSIYESDYTLAQVFCPGVVHGGVDLVADEDREHVVGQDLTQANAQGEVGDRLAGAGQGVETLPVDQNIEVLVDRDPVALPAGHLRDQPAGDARQGGDQMALGHDPQFVERRLGGTPAVSFPGEGERLRTCVVPDGLEVTVPGPLDLQEAELGEPVGERLDDGCSVFGLVALLDPRRVLNLILQVGLVVRLVTDARHVLWLVVRDVAELEDPDLDLAAFGGSRVGTPALLEVGVAEFLRLFGRLDVFQLSPLGLGVHAFPVIKLGELSGDLSPAQRGSLDLVQLVELALELV
jgi:hypothetical protein